MCPNRVIHESLRSESERDTAKNARKREKAHDAGTAIESGQQREGEEEKKGEEEEDVSVLR